MSLEQVITEQAANFGGLIAPDSAAKIAESLPGVVSTLPGSILRSFIDAGFSQGEYTQHLKPAAKPAEQPAATDQGGDLIDGIVKKIAWQQANQVREGMFVTSGLRAPRDRK